MGHRMQTFGNFIDKFPPEQDSLELTFTPTSVPLKKRWRNNRLSAYFIADYFTTFLPLDDSQIEEQKRIHESKSAVSYVANELLENAMKYNYEEAHSQIKFGVHFLQNSSLIAVVFASNSVTVNNQKKLENFIHKLQNNDPENLYIEHLEKNALEEDQCSGLGILTIINDYNGEIGWKFEKMSSQNHDSFFLVTTMVQIEV
ncbi:DUF6272 family protein [Cyanobacterium aponinum UTEX 3222]|uniref:ATP-binding protein n=2 Tax=Cyanobacterium aponinum TaxID=379064 RepID=A0A844GYY1_9CHRO|nr:DUF6272 family protein [Cyanobacterium aponinum]MTF39176.1 ATP-binding protein [Cyanobacterium aponinum 0216]WPF89891.1 DUF6272 family protein [Cyanobacterium aponinum AL20115]WRL37818.1 DUF6272 family protein [Cyanobacterium aponinum UTEX 3221]WRL41704.1 DUF6272 family protein [Cyanobacterium aponinum UTEX 3222]